MFISSAISQPHIIALICKHEARCLILIIDQPGVRTVQQTMLQNYWLESLPDDRVLFLDTKESEDVAILGDDFVRFHRIAEVFTVVHDR